MRKVFKANNGEKITIDDARSERETFIDLLAEKTKTIGHQLSWKEASSFPDSVRPRDFANYGFSRFDDAAKAAWLKVKPKDSSGLTEQGKKLKVALCHQ